MVLNQPLPLPDTTPALAALDQLLWRWKSPLQREWYPLLMGLKHDLAIGDNTLPLIRLQKPNWPFVHAT